MYIAIEGIKGAGKSTLLDALCERLQREGVDFELLAPTRPVQGPHLMEWMAQRPLLRERDGFRQRLYAWRSNTHARRARRDARLVLGDRSLLTSLATRWPESGDKAVYVDAVRRRESEIAWPDRVIYLEVSLPVVEERLRHRCRDYGKRDECAERLMAADRAYREMAETGALWGIPAAMEWSWCDAGMAASEVLEEVYAGLRKACLEAWVAGSMIGNSETLKETQG